MTVAPKKNRFRAPWIIFWVALGLRVACILIGHTYHTRPYMDHFGFGWEMGRIARSLALGQGFANPFNGPSGPSAWTPPLYPLLMALSFKLFGIYTNAAALFLLCCNSVFSAATAPAVYEMAARCFDARAVARRASKYAQPVALWSAWLWAVYPAALQYAIHWIWEMSLSTFLFSWILVLALRLRGTGEDPDASGQASGVRGPRYGAWTAFGALWGLLALSNASLLLCLPASMIWILWPCLRRRMGPPGFRLRPVAGAVLACVAFAAVMSPWVIRNELVLHSFILTRSELGVEMDRSMLPGNGPFPWGTTLPLWSGAPEFKRFVAMGEVAYSRACGKEAEARIRAHPGVFARRALDRFLFFWDDTPHADEKFAGQEFLRNLSYAFLSLCGLLGLALAWRRRVPGTGLIALVFLLAPLPYYLVTVQARFRHPIEPLIAILGVYLFRSTQPRKTAMISNRAKGNP